MSEIRESRCIVEPHTFDMESEGGTCVSGTGGGGCGAKWSPHYTGSHVALPVDVEVPGLRVMGGDE